MLFRSLHALDQRPTAGGVHAAEALAEAGASAGSPGGPCVLAPPAGLEALALDAAARATIGLLLASPASLLGGPTLPGAPLISLSATLLEAAQELPTLLGAELLEALTELLEIPRGQGRGVLPGSTGLGPGVGASLALDLTGGAGGLLEALLSRSGENEARQGERSEEGADHGLEGLED